MEAIEGRHAMEEEFEETCQEEFDTFKKLIMIQLRRIEMADTLDEAKKINHELIEAMRSDD